MNQFDALSKLQLLCIEGQHRGLFKDRLGRALMRLASNDILDPETAGMIEYRVLKDIRSKAFKLEPFESPKLFGGNLILGFTLDGKPITIDIQWLNAGILEVANTGSGKTNRCSFWAMQISQFVLGMWLVDLKKTEFRFLHQPLAQKGIKLRIARGRKFKFNPLQVPFGIDPNTWAAQTADLLVKVLNLPPRASVLITSSIIRLYRKHGIFGGSIKFPTLFELFEAIKSDKGANIPAKQAVLDSMELVLLALGPQVLGYHQGWTAERLALEKLVVELSMLPEAAKDLILNWMVQSEFTRRILKGISNHRMNLWIAFDEAQRLFSQRKDQHSANGNAITDQAGLIRGTGIGISASVLTTNDLSSIIPNLTSTKVIGRCGCVSEYTAAGGFIGLNQEQILWLAHHAIPGMFAAQVSEGQWRFPFIFKVPFFDKSQMIPLTDEQADATIEDMDAGKIVPAVIPSDVVEIAEHIPGGYEQCDSFKLTQTELKVLKAVVENPMRISSEYVKLAKVSPNTLSKVRPQLIAGGFIAEHISESTERGRNARRLEPLEKAKQVILASIEKEQK